MKTLRKLILLILVIAVYNIFDNLYYITPRLIIEIQGVLSKCIMFIDI